MKVAVVTGASRGIGEAIARKLASNGFSLSICCNNSADKLYALADELREAYSTTILTHVGNIADADFVKSMINDTLKEFGHIDVLVNNAGRAYIGLLSDMRISEWDDLLQTNLSSVFYTCKNVIPNMVHNKSGHIINISSVWGNVGASMEVAYSATKGGINSLTKALAKELAPSGIAVNAIACGVIDTQMNNQLNDEEKNDLADEIPAGRFGTPNEVADCVYSLINSSNYLTGQIITLDGGWT